MFGGKMATTPSWLSCLKPHVSWVFGQLRHFNFSGPGATHREARKSFASFFKSCGVWGSAPRSRGCKGRRSRLPARSALDGAHRAPAPLPSPTSKNGGTDVPLLGWHRARRRHRACRKLTQSLRLCQGTPDEGSLRKDFRRKPFLPSCVCRRRRRSWDAVPHPATFEKVGETFTCLSQA